MELYHYQGSGNDYSTVGVQIPNSQNTVSVLPTVQSINITCPTDYEVLQFKLANAQGGQWRIEFDYLSSDGKKIDSTIYIGYLSYAATESAVKSSIQSATGYTISIVKTLLTSDGTVITNATNAVTTIYTAAFLCVRDNGVIPY